MYDPYTVEWQSKALIELFNVLENKSLKEKLVEENYKWAKNMSWESRTSMFIQELEPSYKAKDIPYIKNIDNRFDYADMYNWTNDLPSDMQAYDQYIRILDYIKWKNTNKEINVLEIGTFVGTSIIKILEYLPKSKGSVIDLWKDYDEKVILKNGNIFNVNSVSNIKNNNIENIFHSNIKIAGINNVKVFKGDSSNILQNMILENNYRFDFIYIDGSHMLMDSYTDLLLSFNLLNKGTVWFGYGNKVSKRTVNLNLFNVL